MEIADWLFVALATLPSLVTFVLATTLDKPAKMPVAFFGMGLGVLLGLVGIWLWRGARGSRRLWLTFATLLALVPFTLMAFAIGIQWLFYLLLKLFGR